MEFDFQSTMVIPPKDRFTFTWNIENFGMCPLKQNDYLRSPAFYVESLKSSWQLQLFPRGERRVGYMACFLKLRNSTADTSNSKDLDICVCFSLVSVDPEKKISRSLQPTYKGSEIVGIVDFVPLNDLDRDTFFPNDILTVICELWRPQENYQEFVPRNCSTLNERSAENCHNFQRQSDPMQCSVRTQIQGGKKSVFWNIENFSALQPNQKLSLEVVSEFIHLPSLTLTFYLSGECVDDLCGNIEIQKDKNYPSEIFVKCRVSVSNESKKYRVEDERLFEVNAENDAWKLASFIQRSTLFKDKYLDTTSDVLNLLLQFTYSRLDDVYHACSDAFLPSACHPIVACKTNNPFQNEFKNLYEDGNFSDFTLLVGNKKFKVHRCIVGLKSSVFSAMFEKDMKEKQTGIVDITDLEADTVDLMLSYMYTNILGDVTVEEALKLYSAAEKYAVLPLKFLCRCLLINSIDLSNLCNILGLADLHQDVDLLDAVQDFIRANARIVLLSQEWDGFITLNSLRAARVMQKILV